MYLDSIFVQVRNYNLDVKRKRDKRTFGGKPRFNPRMTTGFFHFAVAIPGKESVLASFGAKNEGRERDPKRTPPQIHAAAPPSLPPPLSSFFLFSVPLFGELRTF